jgi:26S proteasome regulatory subunit T1
MLKRVNELAGIKESDTGLAPPALWDLAADKQVLSSKTNPPSLPYDRV